MCQISKVSNATSSKNIKILNSILNYYYYFNELGDKVNAQMKMKHGNKKLNLLGNFKLWYDKDSDVFNTIILAFERKSIVFIFKSIDIELFVSMESTNFFSFISKTVES